MKKTRLPAAVLAKRQAVGQRLAEIRSYLGYTQEQVAQHLHVHRPTVTMWESGAQPLKVDQLERLAELYQYPLSYFVYGRHVATWEPPAALKEAVQTLPPEDVGELVRFAEFLQFRAQAKKGSHGHS